MVMLKSFQFLVILAGALSPALVTFASLPPQLTTQSALEWKVSVKFPPIEEVGAPESSGGGGTRGEGEMPKALMPQDNMGTTVAANPTLFLYVPKTQAKSAEFLVINNQGKEVYQKIVPLAGAPGVVKVSLPETASLEVGKDYKWYFGMIENPEDRSEDKHTEGKIRRIELSSDLKTKIEKAAPLEQAKLYAQKKIWLDTLTILAQLRSSQPAQWEELLNSVGLENIAKEPFIECCKPQN